MEEAGGVVVDLDHDNKKNRLVEHEEMGGGCGVSVGMWGREPDGCRHCSVPLAHIDLALVTPTHQK